ncbi:hypothetical protein [Nocardioides gilvus]|uniref:hypothetical protein n=1 Tax=Nocardioides gilvus TaxID=1735589 RepID=UPI000D744D6A|nr:hypothetical protein [Nocardioides gilvus]
MENNDLPSVSAEEARSTLAELEAAQRAVRDTPWPTWLYPVNAVLLGAYALHALIEDPWRLAVAMGIAGAILALNIVVGKRMGTPWILPTSRGFLACVALAAACMVTAVVLGHEHPALVITLAAAATVLYLLGAAIHHRSTRR